MFAQEAFNLLVISKTKTKPETNKQTENSLHKQTGYWGDAQNVVLGWWRKED